MCLTDINTGVQVIAYLDAISAMAWLTLIFTDKNEWLLFLIYMLLAITRLYFFYQKTESDTFKSRTKLYFTHLISVGIYVILFFI